MKPSLPDLSRVSFSSAPSYADLFVLSCGSGYSCLGFDVCNDWTARIARELGRPDLLPVEYGTLSAYGDYLIACQAAEQMSAAGHRFICMLTPQLIGLEGKRVEVIDSYGETRRFRVGRSSGWLPIHLEIKTRRSMGGCGVSGAPFKSLRVIV